MNLKRTKRPVRIGLISLGCAKNLVDSEIMLGSLLKAGMEIVNDAEAADALIVNTCSFIEDAQQESIDAILQSNQLRQARRPGQALIVAGCLPQRFRDQLPQLLPEVDAFMGIDQVTSVSDIVRQALARRAAASAECGVRSAAGEIRKKSESRNPRTTDLAGGSPHAQVPALAHSPFPIPHSAISQPPLLAVTLRPSFIPDYATPRFRLTPRHFAYLKIAEGCNHPCSFCIIPRMRGGYRSRAQADIVAQARQLLGEGVKEINLISQDTTYYGLDLRPQRRGSIAAPEPFHAAARQTATTLCGLLRELNGLPGEFWIRLLYTHPAHWTDELIATMAACPKVARYIDIPLQHIHPNMLERMRRETSEQYIRDLIGRLRAGIPNVALRTTFIVGFPGETQACFERLLEFIGQARFERLGVFAYSREEGTRAGQMDRQLPDKLKKERRQLAMAAQHEVAVRVAEAFVGRTLKVLVEGAATVAELKRANIQSWEHGLMRAPDRRQSQLRGRYLVARSHADAPDIDGRVYVRGRLPVGEFAQVKIIGHTDYDLIGEAET